MAERTVRVDIPQKAEEMLRLGSDVRARHTALGANSPLNNSVVDMAVFAAVHQQARDKRTEGLDAHAFGESAIQAADAALGIAKLQNIDTPGTVYFYTGRIRRQLLLAYQGKEEEISTFGFNVVISGSGSKKTVKVDIPEKNRPEMERLAAKIVKRHTDLGAASPLNNAEVTAMQAQLQIAVDKRTEGGDFHETAEAAMQQSNKALGLDKGQTINTEGTVYYMLSRIRGILLLAYQGVEEEISTFGFNVVITETGAPLIPFLTLTTNQTPLARVNMGIKGTTGQADNCSILWGDATISRLILDGFYQNASHDYLTAGIYPIQQKAEKPENITGLVGSPFSQYASILLSPLLVNLTELNFSDSLLTTVTIPIELSKLSTVFFVRGNLDAASVNTILITINNFGTGGGFINLSGAGNAAPTGAGIAAKNQLTSRGWTVTTN